MNRNMITMMAMVMKLVMASTKKMKKTLVMTMLTRGVKTLQTQLTSKMALSMFSIRQLYGEFPRTSYDNARKVLGVHTKPTKP